jgi:hypothetical protein
LYAAKCGLYGSVGHLTFGFILFPRHWFRPLNRHVSAGNTQVLINGWELPQLEWIIWSRLLGYPIASGSYWLDHLANAGYEGIPIPRINLYMAETNKNAH